MHTHSESSERGTHTLRRSISNMERPALILVSLSAITFSSCFQLHQAEAPEHGFTRNLFQTCRLI